MWIVIFESLNLLDARNIWGPFESDKAAHEFALTSEWQHGFGENAAYSVVLTRWPRIS